MATQREAQWEVFGSLGCVLSYSELFMPHLAQLLSLLPDSLPDPPFAHSSPPVTIIRDQSNGQLQCHELKQTFLPRELFSDPNIVKT